MQPSGMHYFPVEWPFLLALFLLFSLLVVLIELRSLRYAYERMGIPSRYAMAILLVTLLGSSINIPLAEFPPEKVISGTVVHHHGMRYGVPVVRQWPGTVLAINVGGALIPILLSIYLALKNRILMVDAKDTLAHVLDSQRYAVAVPRLQRQCFENQHLQGALHNVVGPLDFAPLDNQEIT